MTTLYVLADSGVEHYTIVGIFDSLAAAEAEKAYCEANDVDMHDRHARGFTDPVHGRYRIDEHPLNESTAWTLYRFTRDHTLTDRAFFTGISFADKLGEVRQYDEVWPDGTCQDVAARSEDDARALLVRTSTPAPERAP